MVELIIAFLRRLFRGSDEARAYRLAELAKQHPELDYKHSVVDLMKLLDMNSSLANRKKLAREYGWEGEYDGSAEMNLFLMREIRRRH